MCVCCGGVGQPTWQLVHACALRPVSQPLQSGSEARQSASSVRLRGPSVSLIGQAPRPVSQPRKWARAGGFPPPRQSGQESRASRPSARPGLPLGPLWPLRLHPKPAACGAPGTSWPTTESISSRACRSPVIFFLKTSLQQPLVSWGCCNHVPQSGGFKQQKCSLSRL